MIPVTKSVYTLSNNIAAMLHGKDASIVIEALALVSASVLMMAEDPDEMREVYFEMIEVLGGREEELNG